MPHRIQRKRTKGWRKPEGSRYVGRPTEHGNPFPQDTTLERFEAYAEKRAAEHPEWLAPLRGQDLSCWCAPNKPCHADILLRLANA